MFSRARPTGSSAMCQPPAVWLPRRCRAAAGAVWSAAVWGPSVVVGVAFRGCCEGDLCGAMAAVIGCAAWYCAGKLLTGNTVRSSH
jgi:hypothetical protein